MLVSPLRRNYGCIFFESVRWFVWGNPSRIREINQKEDITEFKSRSLAKCLLNTFIPGGDSAAQSLIEAWEVA